MREPGGADAAVRPLKRVAERLSRNEQITVLAIGSSSTEGYGASRAEFTYPSRLAVEMKTLLPKADIRVLNRGVGGEDAREMLARMDREMTEAKPDLVLWQVGTNALLHEQGVGPQASLIRTGLSRIHESGADAVLIDPQYAPKVLRDPDAKPMVTLLARVADEAGIPIFRRFALMQFWHEQRDIAFADDLVARSLPHERLELRVLCDEPRRSAHEGGPTRRKRHGQNCGPRSGDARNPAL